MRDRQVIRVLGPIDIETPEGEIAVGGRQVRALLGAFAIGVNHAVPIDHLKEVLWADDPPASADNTLQSYVSHLRGLLGVGAIIRRDHSYQLNATPSEVDATLFEASVIRASALEKTPEERLHHCREALQLWRGRPFGDLADDEAFKLETYRLEEMRLTAMEYSLEAELALGRHELIVGELESAVREHPYHERLWFLLIEALARSGRRVEALREVTHLRRTLSEVGLRVGNDIAELERRVLDDV